MILKSAFPETPIHCFHGGQGRFVALFRHPGASPGNHPNKGLRKGTFQNHGVGNHANVRTQSAQGNGLRCPLLGQNPGQRNAAKAQFVHNVLGESPQFRTDLPPRRALNAVLHRQIPPLLGPQIILPMGIPGENHLPVKTFHQLHHLGHNGPGPVRAQSAGDKIHLHVNNDQIIHSVHLFPF